MKLIRNRKPINIIWQKFNRLTVIDQFMAYNKNKKVWYATCKCDCWWIMTTRNVLVREWEVKSCWCLKKEQNKINLWKGQQKTHNMSNEPIYAVYRAMVNRCNNKNDKQYHLYWWRWIKLLWRSFDEFKRDMYETYLQHKQEHIWNRQTTIDRIDNNGNYCKENCKRATQSEQAINRRNENMVRNKHIK